MQEPSVERRLAAVLHVRVVGHAGPLAARGVAELAAPPVRLAAIARLVARHGGRVASSGEDALLAEFARPAAAVRCALEIREALERLAGPEDDGAVSRARIGIGLGEVVPAGPDLRGEGVDIAGRLLSLAPAGVICICGSVRAAAGGELEMRSVWAGRRRIDGIDRPVEVYRVEGARAGPPPAMARRIRPIPLALLLALVLAAGALLLLRDRLRDHPAPPAGALPGASPVGLAAPDGRARTMALADTRGGTA